MASRTGPWSSTFSTVEDPAGSQLRIAAGSDDVEQLDEVVDRRQGEEHGVEAVEDATVAGQEPPEVLHAEIPLQERLAQVPQRRHDGHHHTERQGAEMAPGADAADQHEPDH